MQDFTSKRSALFASLDDASKELKGTALDQSNRSTNRTLELIYRDGSGGDVRNLNANPPHSLTRNLSRMRGKESIFKKPELPIGKCLKPRKTPDYQINPHKWKKYSLAEVDISDQTNNSAAFAFLKQIDELRESDEEMESSPIDTKAKIEFKKSSKIKRQLKEISKHEVPDEQVDKPRLKGFKLVMPEYVIGQRKDRKKKNPRKVQLQHETSGKQLNLSHLQEVEEDSE